VSVRRLTRRNMNTIVTEGDSRWQVEGSPTLRAATATGGFVTQTVSRGLYGMHVYMHLIHTGHETQTNWDLPSA